MKQGIAALLVVLLSGTVGSSAGATPAGPLPDRGVGTCLAADRSGCGILVRRGINSEGYYLTIETGESEAGSVTVGFRGRSIVIGRSEFRRSKRTDDPGAFSAVSWSSRLSSRLRLPPDADIRRARREEHAGVVTIIVPRLQPPWLQRGATGYHPHR